MEFGDRRATASLGRCPGCGASIPTGRPFVEFETAGDWPRMLAECPSCDQVVHPR